MTVIVLELVLTMLLLELGPTVEDEVDKTVVDTLEVKLDEPPAAPATRSAAYEFVLRLGVDVPDLG